MLKKLISPLQLILLQKKMCPGCTNQLNKSQPTRRRTDGSDLVTCKCGRIFVHDKKLDTYRRALSEEV